MRNWLSSIALAVVLASGMGAYLRFAPNRWSETQAGTATIFLTHSEELFEQPVGAPMPAVLRIECDGARAQVFVDGELEGERERISLILGSDRIGFGNATFHTWRLDPERVREVCRID